MPSIQTYLQQILDAVYGEEVRGAIHDAIEECYTDVTTSATAADAAATAANAAASAANEAADAANSAAADASAIAQGMVRLQTPERQNISVQPPDQVYGVKYVLKSRWYASPSGSSDPPLLAVWWEKPQEMSISGTTLVIS